MKSLEIPVRNLGDAPEGQSVLVVADTTALAAVITTFLSDGTLATLGDGSQHKFNANATTGGIQPITGNGRWYPTIGATSTFNVKNYGAKGDGVNDDTTAIQNAINAAQLVQGCVLIPGTAQYYKTTSSLIVTNAIKIKGDSNTGTTIIGVGLANGDAIIHVNGTINPNLENVEIESLTFRALDNVPDALKLNRVANSIFKDISFRGVRHGVVVTGDRTFSLTFIHVYCSAGISGNTFNFDAGFPDGGQFTFVACGLAGANGVLIDAACNITSMNFYACNFEGFTTNAFSLNGQAYAIGFYGCRFEKGLGTTTLVFNPAAGKVLKGLVISGCFFETDLETYAVQIGGAGGIIKSFNISGCYIQDYNTFVRLNGGGENGNITANSGVNTLNVCNLIRPSVRVINNEGFTTINGESETTALSSVSADRGDADSNIQPGSDSETQIYASALTANRSITLIGGQKGDKFRIVRTGLGAFTLSVGGLKVIPNSTAAFVDVQHDGAAWILTGYGTL